MDWHDRFSPVDILVGLVGRMDALVAADRLVAPALVKEESDKVGSQGLKQWTDGHSTVFVKTGDLLAPAQVIQGQFPGLLDPKAEFEEADAYVIALAQLRDGIVVTQETPAADKRNPRRSHFIPDVCRDLGIPFINLLGLMRREASSRPLLQHARPGYFFLRVVRRLDVAFRGARRRAAWSFEEHARSQAANSASSISRAERARVA